MYISKIIVWPVQENYPARVIELHAGKVNYIIGESDTGKSSIWPLIDYCLCSSELRIPVGPARDLVSWYGILLKDAESELLIARQNNTIENTKSGFMLLRDTTVLLPQRPKINTREPEVKRILAERFTDFLDEISREVLDELYDKKIGVFSYRDLLTLNHQMQYALVNPSSFIADSNYISVLKLKKLLPLLLYTRETAYYKLRKGMQNKVQLERQQLNKQLEEIESRMKELYSEAHQLGLVLNYMSPETLKPFDEFFWRKELEQLLEYNAAILEDASGKQGNQVKIFLLGKIHECLEFAKIIDKAREFDYELIQSGHAISTMEYDHQKNTINKELQDLSKLVRAYARKLNLNYLEYLPVFDEKDAILKFKTPVNQDIFLYQLGNTQSYVGYNIATFLSFHEFFIQQRRNAVFSFLLLDHPGQAFSSGKKNEDTERFRILSGCLDFAVQRLKGKFQLIVLERVPPDKNLSASVVVENWSANSQHALIPANWKKKGA